MGALNTQTDALEYFEMLGKKGAYELYSIRILTGRCARPGVASRHKCP